MTANKCDLYMIRLRLKTDLLMELGRRRHLPLRNVDFGYLVHCQLQETFRTSAPAPFAIVPTGGRYTTVLAYSTVSPETLKTEADMYADPSIHSACDWVSFAGKKMPETWPEGKIVGFEVRACPTVRMGGDGDHHKKGAEVDVFLARCWAAGSPSVPVDREAVYREWLEENIKRFGGAKLRTLSVRGFKRSRLLRRTHGPTRKAAAVERPDIVFTGEMQVTDPAAFAALVRRGVGRHRAFGFGMLLFRPAGGSIC